MSTDLQQRFLTETDHTGRFIVRSALTGKTYYVEPIGDPHIEWGSQDPTSGDFNVKKGWKKYQGSVKPSESLITEDNGFEKIHTLDPGISPMAYIQMLDDEFLETQNKSG